MPEGEARSVNGVPIRLTEERWEHIIEPHLELTGRQDQVLQALSSPDEVQEARSGAFAALLRHDKLYLVVVYREVSRSDGFVITAHFVRRRPKGKAIWASS